MILKEKLKRSIEKSEPVYKQIKDILREEILLNRGEKIFSQRYIIHNFNVSTITAQRVLNDLEEEGLLERKVGKGSVVVFPSEKSTNELGIIFFDIFNPEQPYISEIVSLPVYFSPVFTDENSPPSNKSEVLPVKIPHF